MQPTITLLLKALRAPLNRNTVALLLERRSLRKEVKRLQHIELKYQLAMDSFWDLERADRDLHRRFYILRDEYFDYKNQVKYQKDRL